MICINFYAQSDSTEWAPIGAKWYYDFHYSYLSPEKNCMVMETVKDTIVNEKSARIRT